MTRIAMPALLLRAMAALVLMTGCSGTARAAGEISNRLLSGDSGDLSAAVPEMAVDPGNPARVAIIWRYLSMADANRTGVQRRFECHLSLSTDGGRSFSDQRLEWDVAESRVCNSPFVDIGPAGELLIGATLTGVLPQDAPEGSHAFGQVGMRLSKDWSETWTPTQSLIASDDGDLFAPNPAVPKEATRVPWDGGRGVVDQQTGAIAISGGFPAPPGEQLHSQRFFTVSNDGGRSWGVIRAWGGAGWPQRWDGTMVSAHGTLAVSYLADAVPLAGVECLCIVFATSDDGGATFSRHFVAVADGFDRLVHYPPLAAHPVAAGRYALAHVAKTGGSPVVWLSDDGGANWRTLDVPAPQGVTRASRPALAYTADGTIVVLWRGYRADGRYHMFMAAAGPDNRFGEPLRVSTAPSLEPAIYHEDYSVRGDFISALAAGGGVAHGAWTDWRSGKVGQIAYARVTIAQLLPSE